MGKVFISFLGTGDYLECAYKYQNRIIKNIRFVQEATIRLNCKDWSEKDRVVIFTTQQSFKHNWIDNGHKDSKTGKSLERTGLGKLLGNLNFGCSVQQVNIPDGRNEAEIWEIFSIVFNKINPNDQIIFDITHAFRSIPMLTIVILNYAKVIKNVSLQGLWYGAMEALGNRSDVEKLSPEKRIVPIIDLTSFDHLMEWSYAIDQFLISGNSEKISNLAENSARTILSRTKGREKSQHIIRRFAGNLGMFTKTLSTCRGRDISDNVIRLKSNLDDCKKVNLNTPLNKPLQPLFEKINKQLDVFPEKSVIDGIQAARWCLDHNLIQQGYTILQETLITYFVSKIGEDPENFQNKNLVRTLANQAVYIFFNGWGKDKEKKSPKEKQIIIKFINFYEKNDQLIKYYHDLTGFRNDLNHCGFNTSPRSTKKIEEKLGELIVQIEDNI